MYSRICGTDNMKTYALPIYLVAFFVFLYGPLLVLLVFSFNDASHVGWPLEGFTTRWYAYVVENRQIRQSILNSILVGIGVALFSCALAVMAAIGFRKQFRGKSALFNLFFLPIIVPGVIGGSSLLVFLGYLGVPFGLSTSVFIAHSTWIVPFALLTVFPSVYAFDEALLEAARDLGGSEYVVFRRIMLPIIMPSILATAIFCFTLSFDEFIRTLFVTGYDSTAPLLLWSLVRQEGQPFLPAVGTIIILVSSFTSLLGYWVSSRLSREDKGGR